MSNLKTCPWCGSNAVTMYLSDKKKWAVGCGNPDCPIRPRTDFIPNKGTAVREWNKRKEQI